MVVVGGWKILQDCSRGDWSISSTAVGQLKDALLKRLNLDRPDIAAAWIKPELPFLMDAIKHMIPFLNGSNVPTNPHSTNNNTTRRQHIDQGDAMNPNSKDIKHIEWTRTNAAQCVALCWSMGAAVRIVETTEGVDLIEKIIDIMIENINLNQNQNSPNDTKDGVNEATAASTSVFNRFRGQCVGALAVLRISLSVQIKTPKKFQVVDTTNVRAAIVQRCDDCLSVPSIQLEFPDVGAITKSSGNGGFGSGRPRQGSLIGRMIWFVFVVICLSCISVVVAGYFFKQRKAKEIMDEENFGRNACGMVTMLALVWNVGNAVFDWSGGDSSADGEMGALTNFVLQSGGASGDIKTKVS